MDGMNLDKRFLKKTGEELQDYLAFRRRGSKAKVKKGKGSKYDRNRFKQEKTREENS